MESLLDRASPRRGSLNSLHRYPSGSFSSNSNINSNNTNTKQGLPSNTLQVNSTNLYALCKDLDKFTRYFVVKAVQVIVESRINGSQKVKTDCKPNGNDWFNLNISDLVEVSDKTKSVLDSEGLSVKSSWRVCCEISLKTNDGSRVVLEHWIITNRTHLNSSQRLNSGQASPKGHLASNRQPSNTNHLTSSNGSGTSPLCAINQSSTSGGRIRPATFSNPSRTRLNSIDDCLSGEILDNIANNKSLLSTTTTTNITNENTVDIKPSTSCFSLTSTQATTTTYNQHADLHGTNTCLNTDQSPSTNSLSTNAANITTTNNNNININPTQQQQQQQQYQQLANNNNSLLQSQNSTAAAEKATATSTKSNATSSIYTIYNRMSLLLKTLLTTAHIMPAYRLAYRSTQTDSCVICYRVYTLSTAAAAAARPQLNLNSRGSIEDINSNFNYSESPSKRSLNSNSSLGSADIREFVSPDELDHFCPILKLGSIRTEINELDVAVCYRTDIRSSSYLLKQSPRSRGDVYNRILDEDCLTAAKQLLAGNDVAYRTHGDTTSTPTPNTRYSRDLPYNYKASGSSNSLNGQQQQENRSINGREQKNLAFLDQPLRPAFANTTSENCLLVEQLGGGGGSANNNGNGSHRNSSKLINGSDGLIESAFESLLQNKTNNDDGDENNSTMTTTTTTTKTTDGLINIANEVINGRRQQQQHSASGSNKSLSNGCRSSNAQSEPIQVPSGPNGSLRNNFNHDFNNRNHQEPSHHQLSLTPGSTPKSLSDSYVFVDLNPPFASDEQNDINSFFHGPSPSFNTNNGLSSLKDVDELTNQLASIEANASQIDDFVDNICASENEDDDEGDDIFDGDK